MTTARDREALSHALRARSPDALREELVRVTEERDALRSVTRRRSEEVERLRRELGMRRERFTPDEAAERMLMVKDIVEEQHRALQDENRELRSELVAICRSDTPWPLHEVLARLVHAAEHLLRDHGCDTHGHEGIRDAAVAGRSILAGLSLGGQAVTEECDRDPETE